MNQDTTIIATNVPVALMVRLVSTCWQNRSLAAAAQVPALLGALPAFFVAAGGLGPYTRHERSADRLAMYGPDGSQAIPCRTA